MSNVPEDRLKTGVAQECSVADNIISNTYYESPLSIHGFLKPREIDRFAREAYR